MERFMGENQRLVKWQDRNFYSGLLRSARNDVLPFRVYDKLHQVQINPVRDLSLVEKDKTLIISHAVRYADKYIVCCIPTACCLWLWNIFSTKLKSLTGLMQFVIHLPFIHFIAKSIYHFIHFIAKGIYHFIHFITLLTLIFIHFTAISQPQLREIPALPCMATTFSTIIYPGGDSTAYYSFFKKLDKLLFEGEGNVTILHIGGSHIQAGTFSHQNRSNLLGSFPGITGNRGLLFPFSAAKTNNPYNYRTTFTGEWDVSKNTNPVPPFALGLSGISIASKDTLACIEIQMRNNENLFFDFNVIHVLGHCDSGWITPQIQLDDSTYIEGRYDTARLAYRFDLEKYVDGFRLSFRINDSLWEPFYLRGFWVENQLPGLTYVDVGVNGASVPSYLKCGYLENDLSFAKPDLCIFSIGINDASGSKFDTLQFQRNYKELIQRIKSVAPDCAILFTTNNDSYIKSRRTYYNNANGLLAQKAFLSLARQYKTGVWDLFSFMGGLGSMKKWEQEGLSQKDKVHFTAQGYKLLGDLLYNAFLYEYIKYYGYIKYNVKK